LKGFFVMEHWGKRLSSALREKEISQRKAASIAGVSKSAMSDWTAGASPSNLAAVHRLCEVLDISFAWLLVGLETKHESTLRISGEDKEFSFEGYARIRIDALSLKAEKF
jgi:transcriptional regulator with XRE-family HTH domain